MLAPSFRIIEFIILLKICNLYFCRVFRNARSEYCGLVFWRNSKYPLCLPKTNHLDIYQISKKTDVTLQKLVLDKSRQNEKFKPIVTHEYLDMWKKCGKQCPEDLQPTKIYY